MSFRRGVNRFLVVVIVLWELLWLILLMTMHGGSDTSLFAGMMIGGPVVATLLVRALFWVIEGFKGSPLA
jgi:hypothetical protein